MSAPLKTADGRLEVISGSSRCGKTAYAATVAGTAPRAIAWDPEEQWASLPGWQKITSRADLARAADRPGPGRYAYVCPPGPMATHFDWTMRCAWHSGNKHGPLWVIAEELADVTTPGKAPGYWGIIVRRGMKRGISLLAISQRWAEADKTAFGNASRIVMFCQSSADDERYLERKTRVPAAVIAALKPFHYVSYDTGSKQYTPGKLPFAR